MSNYTEQKISFGDRVEEGSDWETISWPSLRTTLVGGIAPTPLARCLPVYPSSRHIGCIETTHPSSNNQCVITA